MRSFAFVPEPGDSESDDEELLPKVHYSVILQEEDYEDEDEDEDSFHEPDPDSGPKPWDPREPPVFFRIQY